MGGQWLWRSRSLGRITVGASIGKAIVVEVKVIRENNGRSFHW